MMYWPYLFLSYFALFALGLGDNVRGPLFPEILREFQLTSGQGSWMFALTSFCAFGASFFAPIFMTQGRRMGLFQSSLLMMFVGLLTLGFAPSVHWVFLASCVFGLSMGFMGVVQNIMVSEGSPSQHSERTLSGLHSMYGLASLLAPLLIAAFSHFRSDFSWRQIFLLVSLLPLKVFVVSLFFKDPMAKKIPETYFLNINKQDRGLQIWAGLTMAGYVVAEILISSRLALFMRTEKNMDLESSSFYVTGFFVCLLIGRLGFAVFRTPWKAGQSLVYSLCLSFIFSILGVLVHPLFFVLTGLSMAPFYPLSVSWIAENFQSSSAKAISVAMSLQSILVVIMHISVGYITDFSGIKTAFILAPLFLILSGFSYWMFTRKQRLSVLGLIVLLGLINLPNAVQADVENESEPIVLRRPSSEDKTDADWDIQLQDITARIERIVNHKTLVAVSGYGLWSIGEVVAIESQNPEGGVVAFVVVVSKQQNKDLTYNLKLEVLRNSRKNFIQVGDRAFKLDLSGVNPKYKGTTDLMIRKQNPKISSKYRPLFTQGFNIGETAQTLWPKEVLITWYGLAYYGIAERWTVGSFLPANFLGAYNFSTKLKVYESDANVFATGLSYAKIPNDTRSTLNINLIWDSVSSETVVSHTFASVALFTFSQAGDTTAIKSLGSSSLQTGYEFILDDWNRVLAGPVYNFEKKTVGGYLSYLMIWDKFHFSLSANSTNLASPKLSPIDGYYFFFDAYWRL